MPREALDENYIHQQLGNVLSPMLVYGFSSKKTIVAE
jgi:hypothetical protein